MDPTQQLCIYATQGIMECAGLHLLSNFAKRSVLKCSMLNPSLPTRMGMTSFLTLVTAVVHKRVVHQHSATLAAVHCTWDHLVCCLACGESATCNLNACNTRLQLLRLPMCPPCTKLLSAEHTNAYHCCRTVPWKRLASLPQLCRSTGSYIMNTFCQTPPYNVLCQHSLTTACQALLHEHLCADSRCRCCRTPYCLIADNKDGFFPMMLYEAIPLVLV